MNNINKFLFNDQEIRVANQSGEPWFVAKDLCEVLEIKNVSDALKRLDEDEKNTIVLSDRTPGNPNVAIVSESGMYGLVLSSRKPEAKPFRKWVTSEVLPAIRKNGQYSADSQLQPQLPTGDKLMSDTFQLIDGAFSGLNLNPGLIAGLKLNAISDILPRQP